MTHLSELVLDNPTERRRYRTLMRTLAPFAPLVRGARVLDFGSAHGPSLCALLALGAARVVGVEPDPQRVEKGEKLIALAGLTERAEIRCERDTTHLPFPDGAFPLVLANAVLEHIPQPRDAWIRELWRLTAPGGHLIVNETPNKYLPRDVHTTGLLFVPWLPARLAERYAAARGRHPGEEWSQCGWRGIGYFELVRPLSGYELVPERTRGRHRLLHRLGLPASLLDPYPTWVFRRGPGRRAG
jgi:SAM-dependent methyltransferase